MSIFCVVDDKYVPLYRVIWVSKTPHFCGHDDCLHEGDYEVRLDGDESLFARLEERDALLAAIEQWQTGLDAEEGWE